ncbi:hypothetical protein [Glycomyces tenuis]|uniref:hypothetical protein n=1 Tax=Glycomyces tenuis TaxID=58116 RepID=UPI00041EEF84|nr:hypothetical protein [Glycomyces tenuis]
MRAALRIVFSRYGIVVIILLLVVGAIALSQGREDFPLSSGDSEGDSASSDSPSEELTVDDGVTAPECEGEECEEGDSPLHDPYEDVELPDEAADKALGFAEAWIDTAGKSSNTWFQGMQPYMTEEAAELMRGVDPASVPAAEITGAAEIDGGEVRIPMDTGTLVLPMIEGSNDWADQGWLVSAIDWEPA